ncbi:LPPG:FO 2-phospho-L-lactate transferase [Rhizobiales bacterium GAS191]|jgi:LPPG:FO 2-phospho-L-lactate transferase|nr:LPPG:FO 2-phospho-L-lactate transferase [Rhizobiales bacterium GAS113]SED75697.1 LPPG:FO 2-phospho-L-lactate transferase [Rhizobiales bacterium GAS188]SEE79123.1 LPPG:FO 2-phospho-L-lactate transferase [Rhizobiales bacterium GAS191]
MSGGEETFAGMQTAPTYVALSGGVGGAKLSLGLAHLLGERLTIIVNTGDDFEHLGLHVSPDVDTALYTLAGLVNPEAGWGRRDETWSFMSAVAGLGGPGWFRLGDGDLAMHVERTRRLRAGDTLTDICAHVRERLDVAAHVLPMSDDPVRTIVDTDAGTLAFQEYFVREQCGPSVRSIRFEGAGAARAQPRCIDALAAANLAGVIICPSNPYLSVDPILAVPGMAAAIRACRAPVIAVTPIIGGRAIKGPAAKIMKELGLACDVATITRHYDGLIDGFVLDTQDAGREADLPVPALVTNTMMRTLDDKIALAAECLAFCGRRPRSRPQ